jgi:hypothetical protein
LDKIKEEYMVQTGHSMGKDVCRRDKGDYSKVMLALLNEK